MLIKSNFLLVFAIATLFAFTSASQITKSYDYSGFTNIKVSHAFHVEITQSESFKVSVECSEDVMEKIDIQVHGNQLKIAMKSGKSANERPKAIIEMPMLSNLDVSGASLVKLIKINSGELEVEISGASEIQGDLNVKHIEIDASGASSVGVSGMAQKMELYLSGASSFKGKGFLVTDEVLFDASGASSAHCQTDGDMFVKLSGASSLTYHGDGDIIKQEISGASEIRKE